MDNQNNSKTEKKLKDSEERYHLLYKTSRDAIMTLEPPTWNFTAGNPAAIKMFGVKNEKEFTSKHPVDYSPEKQPDGKLSSVKAKEMITKAIKEGSNFFEWSHRRLNGENFLATVLLTRVEDGERVFLQATVRDISEQKRAEEELKEKMKELERVNKLMIGRELKMVELKRELLKLKNKK